MAEPSVDDRGIALLARISNEIVKAQKECWGKGPTAAKSYMFDDMLFVVMHGGLLTAEGQFSDGEIGAATAEDALDHPASSGQ